MVTGTMDLCFLGGGDLGIYSRQTDQNITQSLPFLDDFVMFYQQFGVNLSFNGVWYRYVWC